MENNLISKMMFDLSCMEKDDFVIDLMSCDIQNTESIKKYIYQLIIQTDALNQHSIVSQTDIHGNINYVNDLFCKISGFSKEELLGKNHRIVKSNVHPDTLYKELWKTIRNGDIWSGEICNQTKSGEHYWVKTVIMPLPNQQGYVSIRTDITEQKRIENELKISIQNLEKSNKIKSQFLANMSHEVRTPLNAILGLAQVLKRSNLNSSQQAMVNKIDSAGNILLRNLNDILHFSEIENGQINIQPIAFSLNKVLSEVYEIEYPIAKEKGLTLALELPTEDLFLHGDSVRISQILLNLVGNAIKFTLKGEVKISTQISIKNRKTPSHIRFTVSDTGIGISPDEMNKLFKPFSQVDASITRRFGGTGLGLSICKSLVEIMLGQIGVESSPGEGSTFWFELPFPLVSNDTIEKDGAPSLTAYNQTYSRLQGKSVLVVDDSEFNRYMMQCMLESEGANVMLAVDGKEAIHILTSHPKAFDFILMDIQMPGMDGFEAVTCIREKLLLLDVPVIICSANTDPEKKSMALKVGADGFIEKPINLDSFIALLNTFSDIPNFSNIKQACSDSDEVWPHIDGIQGNQIKQQIGGDIDFYIDILAAFNKELYRALDQLPQKIKNQDWLEASHFLHKLRGAAGVVFAVDLAALCTEFENALQHHISKDKANFCLEIFLTHTQDLSNQIDKALKRLHH